MSAQSKRTPAQPEDELDRSLEYADGGAVWRFCLYIAGESPHSRLADHHLRSICDEFLPGRSQVEVINVLDQPGRALDDGVLVTPTLVKLSPPPAARLMGNLSDRQTVLRLLGLPGQEGGR